MLVMELLGQIDAAFDGYLRTCEAYEWALSESESEVIVLSLRKTRESLLSNLIFLLEHWEGSRKKTIKQRHLFQKFVTANRVSKGALQGFQKIFSTSKPRARRIKVTI